MTEWWSYSLSDALMFSGRVYDRLFILYNQDIWPAQLLAIGLGLSIIVILLRTIEAKDRLISVILGASWIWVAWGFLWERFAVINWPAAHVAPAFGAQGALLILIGALGRGLAFNVRGSRAGVAGLVLFATVLILYPLVAGLTGRPWMSGEIFGLAPDPTALGTLALLAFAEGSRRWLLIVIPALWCAVSTLMLAGLEAAAFFLPAAGAVAALAIAFAKSMAQSYGQDET